MRNSIHQSGLDYAALVTERKRSERERESGAMRCIYRMCVCVYERWSVSRGREGEARIEVERNWPWSTLRLDAAAAEGTKWAEERTRLRNKEKRGERWGAEREREAEKRSWDSGVDDQTPRQRAKQQRRRRQKQQRAALAVAEGGMPFIFSSLSCTSEALSHIFPAGARGLEASSLLPRPTRDARPTEKPRSGSSPRSFSCNVSPRHVGFENHFSDGGTEPGGFGSQFYRVE